MKKIGTHTSIIETKLKNGDYVVLKPSILHHAAPLQQGVIYKIKRVVEQYPFPMGIDLGFHDGLYDHHIFQKANTLTIVK